jgi:hypothetical protein
MSVSLVSLQVPHPGPEWSFLGSEAWHSLSIPWRGAGSGLRCHFGQLFPGEGGIALLSKAVRTYPGGSSEPGWEAKASSPRRGPSPVPWEGPRQPGRSAGHASPAAALSLPCPQQFCTYHALQGQAALTVMACHRPFLWVPTPTLTMKLGKLS